MGESEGSSEEGGSVESKLRRQHQELSVWARLPGTLPAYGAVAFADPWGVSQPVLPLDQLDSTVLAAPIFGFIRCYR
jgi:hypothetical protein